MNEYLSEVVLHIVFLAQNLKYSVKNDVGLIVFDQPGKASGHWMQHFY